MESLHPVIELTKQVDNALNQCAIYMVRSTNEVALAEPDWNVPTMEELGKIVLEMYREASNGNSSKVTELYDNLMNMMRRSYDAQGSHIKELINEYHTRQFNAYRVPRPEYYVNNINTKNNKKEKIAIINTTASENTNTISVSNIEEVKLSGYTALKELIISKPNYEWLNTELDKHEIMIPYLNLLYDAYVDQQNKTGKKIGTYPNRCFEQIRSWRRKIVRENKIEFIEFRNDDKKIIGIKYIPLNDTKVKVKEDRRHNNKGRPKKELSPEEPVEIPVIEEMVSEMEAELEVNKEIVNHTNGKKETRGRKPRTRTTDEQDKIDAAKTNPDLIIENKLDELDALLNKYMHENKRYKRGDIRDDLGLADVILSYGYKDIERKVHSGIDSWLINRINLILMRCVNANTIHEFKEESAFMTLVENPVREAFLKNPKRVT